MTTLAISSEMDAAEALLELQRDNRESKYEHSCDKENKSPMASFLYNLIGSRTSLSAVQTNTSTPRTSPCLIGKSELTPPYRLQKNQHTDLYRPHRQINNNNVKCKVKQEAVITKVWSDSSHDNSAKMSYPITHIQDKATQTEIEYQMPEIEKMEAVIRELCTKIKSLENRLKTKTYESSPFVDSVTDLNTDVSNDERSTRTEPNCNGRRNYKRKRTSTINTDIGDFNSSSANIHEKSSSDSDLEKNISTSNKQSKLNHTNKTKNEMIPLGDGNAIVPSKVMKNMDWSSYTNATRKLLTAVFSRKVLATHSLTGKPSPAFPDKPAKKKLNSSIVNDIVQTVVEKCHVPESVVRTSITTKCADESKMFRSRQLTKKKRNRQKLHPIKYELDSDDSYLSS